MTERLTKHARTALIVGDRAGRLEPDETADLALLTDLLAQESTWTESAPTLEERIVRAVDGAGRSAATGARSAADARHPRWRRRVAVTAAASAAAVAVVVATLLGLQDASGPDYAARLTATGLAPGARGTAELVRSDAGFRVSLATRGLPLLPDGEFYQAWLKNATGTLVPVGTFSSSDGQVTLWSGVPPEEFTSITVTIERADNDQASSGRRVLAGTVRPR
jgi:hypothetical protein